MDLNVLVEKLRVFDLFENEAKVYLALVLKGPLRPSEIADVSGVARAEVHRHLRELEKKGLCVVIVRRGKKYSAVSPAEALDLLVEQEEIRRDQMLKRKSEIVSAWSGIHPTMDMPGFEHERLQALRDRQIALQRGIKIAIDSKKTCRVILRRSTIEEYISSDILQFIQSAGLVEKVRENRAVAFRLLLISQTPDIGNLAEVLGKVELPPNFEVRWATSTMLDILPDAVISDDNEMLIHTSQSQRTEYGVTRERAARAVVTNVSAMITSFTILFDQYWKDATKFRP